ncbi:response regulator transcription factor [Lentzea sp. NPDC051208]|uniref:winged helix-turn-helix transcriptional regulator n=1 Tax=Lentzea sp. NPDC051208 TaxID=3154642 RepID=UPI0034321931
MRILVVDEDDEAGSLVASAFPGEQPAPTVVGHNAAAESLAAAPYDVVVVAQPDRLTTGMWGALRAADPQAQLLAAVRGDDFTLHAERWTGLGVDGYLSMPCDSRELRARIRAAARRTTGHLLHHDELVLHRARREASRAGRTVSLNDKEYALLEVLVRANGTVVTADELRARCWGLTQNATTGVVRNTIMKLRRKLGEPQLINTVAGIGYRLRRAVDSHAAS